jgi:hypothetical protein
MRVQKLTAFTIIALLLVGTAAICQVKAYPGTNVYVDPPTVEKLTTTTPIGSTLAVTLNFGNMTNLGGIEYKLYWNRTILNFVSVHDALPWTGPFIASNESTNDFNATYGRMYFVCVSMLGGFTGSMAFRTITFKIMIAPSGGTSQISTAIAWGPYGVDVIFGDTLANLIPATTHDGQFIYRIPSVKDTTPPVTKNNYDGLWHTSDFTITLTATDDSSGVAETFYITNGGATKTVSTDGQPLITTEGSNNKLEYWSTDKAGNAETHNVLNNIKLDKTTPTGSITIDNGASSTMSTAVTLTLTTADTLSGVDKIRLGNQADLSVESWTAFSATKTWQLTSGNGNKTVYYEVRDVAGLISIEYSASIILNTIVSGPLGEALEFSGTNQYVSIPAVDSRVYTFDLWFNPSSCVLIGSDRFKIANTNNSLTIWYDINKPSLKWYPTIVEGAWHNLVVVIDYRVWRVTPYLDGVALGAKYGSTQTKPSISWMRIGSDGKGGFFKGIIDEVRIYNIVLDASAVQSHYNDGIGYYGRKEKGLIEAYHFDESAGQVAMDYSGNNRNGTIVGTTWVDGHIRLPSPSQGDINGDARVNILDLILVSNAFNTKMGDVEYDPWSDTNGDKRIDILDMITVATNLGRRL